MDKQSDADAEISGRGFLATTALTLVLLLSSGPINCAHAGYDRPQITSFAVDDFDTTLSYDSSTFIDLPDEHSTLLPLPPPDYFSPSGPLPITPPWPFPITYLLFRASRISSSPAATGGAVVLSTTDLTTFSSASALGYADQVMAPPLALTTCGDGTYDQEFDENYAAPGSVLQDPTRPPGNLIMIYEAENHCPGGQNQHGYYATVGFARSSDEGHTWPAPVNSEFGDGSRHPVLKAPFPEPSSPGSPPLGNAIPSGFIDINIGGEVYLYVTYGFHDGNPADEGIRIARVKLGHIYLPFVPPDDNDQPEFHKWYNRAFSQPGIGGMDSAVLSGGCAGKQQMSEITYNDDLGLYLMVFVCNQSSTGNAAWYYSTATNLELQDWTTPQPILNSELPITSPCRDNTGSQFDGFYPSLMSPNASAGHTRLTGRVFFMNGCDTGKRTFASRGFTITIGP